MTRVAEFRSVSVRPKEWPPHPKAPQVTPKFDPETWQQLKAAADRRNVTITELVKTYVEWGLETDGDDHSRL